MAQKWRTGPNQRKTAPKALNEAALEELALTYVGRFATSRGKLAAYLARKLRERGWEGAQEPPIEGIADRLVALGYVDDRAYAAMKSGAMQRRGLGQRRIAQTLHQDGIDAQHAAEAQPDVSQRWEAAERLAKRKRIGPFAAALPDRATREKQIAVFLRAGHDLQTARRWIDAQPDEMPPPPEDWD